MTRFAVCAGYMVLLYGFIFLPVAVLVLFSFLLILRHLVVDLFDGDDFGLWLRHCRHCTWSQMCGR